MKQNVMMLRIIWGCLLLFATGCCRTCPEEIEIPLPLICEPLPEELTLDQSVRLALLYNPHLQASVEEIGIAYADWVEAGLWSNPMIDATVRFPSQSWAAINTGFSIMQGFVDILLAPRKREIAGIHYHQAELHVIDEVRKLTADVQSTYYSLQEALAAKKVLNLIAESDGIANELAKGQKEAGNISLLDWHRYEVQARESRLQVIQIDQQICELREKLNLLMGISDSCWTIAEALPEPFNECLNEGCLRDLAFANRRDLQILQWEYEAFAAEWGIKNGWAYTQAQIGVSTEQEIEHVQVTGPAIALALPIFNWGQGQRMRLEAEMRKQTALIAAKQQEIDAEVTVHLQRFISTQTLANDYRFQILPIREKLLNELSLQYNVMAAGPFDLLDSKRQLLEARLAYARSLAAYWMAYVSLERSLGVSLTCL